ncbi:ATP-dependent DNA helicase PIF1 [Eumeta japonica]|uniref:ATP-dependent DNA helicase PIF1 n=1 Tax=Eumeta variegata TaxID=151549 RepID=A0A4C2ABQ6_EUMVA|nr:ATP-dependent DNA helicase PIF1 [Eumeta japonica]
MLRRNINVNQGLLDGAMSVIRKIVWAALRRDQLEVGELLQAVFVRIEPSTVAFDALRGQEKIERRILPLILFWAVTVHKLQGTTLNKAFVDLSSCIFAKRQAHVALSRISYVCS